MFTIHLSNLKFFSHHGVHEEERILGANFIVEADVAFTQAGTITLLEQTVDYTKIYEIIKQRMAQPTALLETVAQDLAHNIHLLDKRIQSVNISIKKVNPPIMQFSGSISVRFKKDFLV
jgi:7,8-dihydroneopterin aldolase/epimerase/oxygenase